MSQSRFSIVLVGVSALLRRPLVSRLRPAAFTARGSGGFRRSALPSVSAFAARRVGLRAHGFRFSARTASGLPLGELVLLPSVSEIAAGRVGSSASRFGVVLGGLAFGLTASAFRHAPLRRLPLGELAFGSRLPLFGMRRSAPPRRRSEGRRSTPTRHLFHFKTLIPTC